MTNWAQIFTGLLFYAYDGIHQVRTLVFDNYQTCTVPLKNADFQKKKTQKPYSIPTEFFQNFFFF